MLQKLRAAYVTVRLDGAGLTLAALGLTVLAAAAAVALQPVIGLVWALVVAGLALLVAGALLLWLPRRRQSAPAPSGQAGDAAADQTTPRSDDLADQAKQWAAEHPVETLVIGAAVGGLLMASPRARRIVRDGLGVAAAADRLRDRPAGVQSSR